VGDVAPDSRGYQVITAAAVTLALLLRIPLNYPAQFFIPVAIGITIDKIRNKP